MLYLGPRLGLWLIREYVLTLSAADGICSLERIAFVSSPYRLTAEETPDPHLGKLTNSKVPISDPRPPEAS
jgi:hypothetical protein